MEWIYVTIQIFALFLTTLWFFTWLCERRNGTGWLFELKRQLALRWVSRRKRRVNVPTDYPYDQMENLIDGFRDDKNDSNIVNYYGIDQRNNYLFVKINHRNDNKAELTIFLGFEDGRSYELPEHPNTVINRVGESNWSAGGLKIHVLESKKRTRIIFNGVLRKGRRTDSNIDNEDDVEHVRFNCIFIGHCQPYPRQEFWSTKLQAETLAHNSWRKSKWQQLIRNVQSEEIDQYGSIMGEVVFQDSSRVELYLHSLRQSQWGKRDARHFDRYISIVAFDTVGNWFHIDTCDIANGLKKVQFGHLFDPSENLHQIDSLNFNAEQLLDRLEKNFNESTFQFTAGGKSYDATIKLQRISQRTLYGGYPWDSQYIYCNFELKLNDSTGVGMIQICRPYTGTCPVKLPIVKRFVKSKKSNENPEIYTIPFDDKRCQNENLVGGKGASLAELNSIETAQFIVPKGFCVTSHALESHVKYHRNLSDTVDEFVKICTGEIGGDVKDHCEKIVSLMETTPVLHTVETAILKSFEQLGWNGQNNTYAVRSSAVGEDSEDTSAAGQNSTYLGIKNVNDIVKYVAHCWASLYTYQSVEYRRQHGMPIKASMGVCVQQMVDAEAAGVMFTRHPITGNPKEIYITSNYGLGETVVSALVDPDTIIIERSRKNSLIIRTSTIGQKSQKITIKNEGGTLHQNLSTEESTKLSISQEYLLKLGEIGMLLDELYDAPRDIEWAISQNRVYLLQCRPVTALDAWTDFEVTHELGTGIPNDNDILTFANVGEVLPMVLTPLTLTSVVHSLNASTEINVTGKFVLDTYKTHMFIVNMRCTLNYMNLLLRHVDEKNTLDSKVTEIAVCGHSILTPEIHEAAKRRNGVIGLSGKLYFTKQMILDLWRNSDAVNDAGKVIERCRNLPMVRHPDGIDSPNDLYRMLTEMIDQFTRVAAFHSHTSKCSIFYQVLTMSILTEGSDQFTMEHYSDIAILLGSCSDVISAQVPVALKEITQTIKETGLSERFQAVELTETMDWLLTNCPKAYNQVQQFMKMHGYRGIEEFELTTETWGMKPEKFIATIKTMLNSTEETNPTKDLTPSETVRLLKTPRKSSTRWILRALLPATRKAVARRETTKALLIEMVHNLRIGYRRLATLLKRQGRLPDENLIFFITHKEIREFIERPSPALIRKAIKRKKIRPVLQKYKYKEIYYGMVKPVELDRGPTTSGSGTKIQGTSVCNGVATGRACVALTLEEAAGIQPGDILITVATDIGWSPYFPLLSGVVTELGGLISHGAVVAREYGLPCIVSAENATRIFQTGETVTLNGFAGTIEAVKETN